MRRLPVEPRLYLAILCRTTCANEQYKCHADTYSGIIGYAGGGDIGSKAR